MDWKGHCEISYLDHTADVRMHLKSKELQGLFVGGVEGMAALIYPGICAGATRTVTRKVELDSLDTTVLLVDFLAEILTQSHLDKAVFCDVKVMQLSETRIEASISGVSVEYFIEDLKAVTYHEAEVRQSEDGCWETMIIFDI